MGNVAWPDSATSGACQCARERRRSVAPRRSLEGGARLWDGGTVDGSYWAGTHHFGPGGKTLRQ